jgi:hypothetical protein
MPQIMKAPINMSVENGVPRRTTALSAVILDAFRDIFDVWSDTWILCPASGYQLPMVVCEFLRARGMSAAVECNQNFAILSDVMIR